MTSHQKILTLIVVVGLILGIGISAYIIYAPSSQREAEDAYAKYLNRIGEPEKVITQETKESTYTDSSGFSFRYPTEVSVSDITPADSSYFTALLLKKGAESLKVDIKDTTFTTTDSWYAREGQGRKLVGATSLGGISAQQYTDNETLYTVAVDQKVLYLIESPRDIEYWDKVHDRFVETFAFVGTQEDEVDPQVTPNTSGVIYLEEEVIK